MRWISIRIAVVTALTWTTISGPSFAAPTLRSLAEARFGRLTQAELRMLQAAATGEIEWIGPSSDQDDPTNDPSHAAQWGEARTIRAELIRWLYVDPAAVNMMAVSGLGVGGARIKGKLDLARTRMDRPLELRHCSIPDGITLSDAEARFLDFRGSWTGPISGTGLVVQGAFLLSVGFRADGEVTLTDSRIQGSLSFNKATILSDSEVAVSLSNAQVEGDITLDNFNTNGEVKLDAARIRGSLISDKATIKSNRKSALSLLTAHVEGDVLLSALTTNKLVDVSFAAIDGSLAIVRTQFDGDWQESGLQAINAQVKGAFDWSGIGPKPSDVRLDLTFAKVGGLADEAKSWPKDILLNEFVYDKFDDTEKTPTDLPSRLKWLARLPDFRPQPYLQLARIFSANGRDSDAAEVLIEKERLQREGSPVSSWFLRWTIGYGYKSMRALVWSVLIMVMGWLIFQYAYRVQLIVPSEKDAYDSLELTGQLPGYYQRFNSFIYSLEAFLPFIDLNQGKHWFPAGKPGNRRLFARFLPWYLRFQILSGWLLSTVFVAGITGIVHKN